jgi:HEAT repeat protein
MPVNHEFDDPEAPPRSTTSQRLKVLGALIVPLLLFAAFRPDTVRAAWDEVARIIELKSDPLPASPPRISDHETEELGSLDAQHQAELLMERAINHYSGAIELIGQHVDGWQGQLELNPHLSGLQETALNSSDLRVRAAALEIYLAAYKIPKTDIGLENLRIRIANEPGSRPFALWMLGALGNRGVEPERAFHTLMDYVNDRDEATRMWAVEGLAHLGTDETIRPLLDSFHNDLSLKVRERAACSLAQSGMLTKNQRMTAVPELLNYMDDTSLDPNTQRWVFQALEDITGAGIGPDPAAWRNWWANHNRN